MKKKLYLDYILMQLLYFIMLGTLASYGSYALLETGYSASEVGAILAMASLLSALLQPLAADISDNSKKFSLFNVCLLISLLSLLFASLTFTTHNAGLLLALIFVALMGITCVYEPLVNSVPAVLDNNGIKVNYGVGRAVGSLGYATANAVLGILTGKFPYQVVFVCLCVGALIMVLVNIKANADFIKLPKIDKKLETNDTISYSQFLKRHKAFIVLIICTAGIFFGYTMYDNMMIVVVENVGGNSSDLGLIMAFKACLEVPVIFFYDKIEKLASPSKLLKLAVIAFCVKGLSLCLAKSVFMLYVNQLVQMFSLSLMVPSMVSYITNIMGPNEVARGQALFVMAITIGQVISSPVTGIIIDSYSASAMLNVSFIVTLISAIAFIITINKIK